MIAVKYLRYKFVTLLFLVIILVGQTGCETIEIIGEEPGRRTADQARVMIEAYLRDQKPDPVAAFELPIEEISIEGAWEAMQIQVFKVRGGIFQNESFLIRDSDVLQLGTSFGGQGLTSLVVVDLDRDGRAELFFAYSFGSGIHQSRIGMYAPAYDEHATYEADMVYLGDLSLFSDDGRSIGVRVVEADPEALTISYQDTIGTLYIEGAEGGVKLKFQALSGLPDEIQQKIITD
jgi:hypothetical protein